MSKTFGFTLVEMLISVAIIGIVSALAIPVILNPGQIQLKLAYNEGLSALNQAITNNISFDKKDFSKLASGDCITPGTICYMFNNRMTAVSLDSAVADENLDPADRSYPVMASSSNYTLFFLDGTVFSFPIYCAYLSANSFEDFCKGVVDVNGGRGPNRLTNCANDLRSITEPSVECNSENFKIGDRYSIRFGGGAVLPNGPGARYALYH